ncbi:MAG: PDZ domain-containing protein [Deltaproteobacteria bacterium]|nr:MAG: PDZ domain-containing protein [Deltaproteobacteria bacterium]
MTLFLALSAALAGDPCPIDLQFAEYTPEWRDRSADLAALESRRTWMGLSYGKKAGLVRVKSVIPGSPAEQAGITVGHRLAFVNGKPVVSTEQANELFDAPSAQDEVEVVFDDEGTKSTVVLRRAPADPVFLGLVNAAENTECRDVRIVGLSDGQRAAIAKGAFNESRAFQCDSAHKALASDFPSGSVVMIRGGSRILLTMPGWTTRCVGVDSLDGTSLTLTALKETMSELAKDYVTDRHENP